MTLPSAREMSARAENIFAMGDVLNDTYEIRGVLGRGAAGQVFSAFDRTLRRRVAIKALWPDVMETSIEKEAQALAAIRHPAVINVHAIGHHGKTDYIVMEHIPGVTLETHLARGRSTGEAMTLEESLDILISVAEGLAALHRGGLAHRDVKPANVILAPGDRIVLVDFGLVIPLCNLEDVDESVGTPAYMAPEAILQNVRAGEGTLVDEYAFGVMAFELLAGKLPFSAGSIVDVIELQLEGEIPDLAEHADVPPQLAELVTELLAKDPADRPPSLEVVTSRLKTIRTERSNPSGDRIPVLIVDDDPDIAKLHATYVRLASPLADITIAHSAKEALACIRKRTPRLMVLDVSMPEMSGVELYVYLRGARLAQRCRMVVVSAGAKQEDVDLLYQLGVADFITKGPSLRSRLVDIVKDIERSFSSTLRRSP
jgi:serine/threonine protein kinase